jgi:DNA replication protein DnaC
MAMTDALLAKHLGRLQWPYFAQHHQTLMAEAARESWPHGRFLEQLVVGEVARRDEALVARRVKAARLPGIKTLDGFDWSWPKKINRAQVQHLFRLEFLPQHGNVILLGGVGVGKTTLRSPWRMRLACKAGWRSSPAPSISSMPWRRRRPPAGSSVKWRA